jgi:Domain of unknown function (DUF4157)
MAFRGVVRRPGQPLTGGVRTDMQARLGANPSDVRIHTDATAHRAAQAVNAQAFTAGSHIAYQRSQYNPISAAGRHTLAHELTHVLQQRSGPVAGTAVGGGISGGDQAERETPRRLGLGPQDDARCGCPDGEPAVLRADAERARQRVGAWREADGGRPAAARVRVDGVLQSPAAADLVQFEVNRGRPRRPLRGADGAAEARDAVIAML